MYNKLNPQTMAIFLNTSVLHLHYYFQMALEAVQLFQSVLMALVMNEQDFFINRRCKPENPANHLGGLQKKSW